MIDGFKPMLASPVDFNKLSYDDLYLSPKLDGIRAIVIDGVVMSRSLKPIPNQHVQKLFGHLEYFDGELIVGPTNAPDVYRVTNSGVMSVEGEPAVRFCAFDHVAVPSDTWENRFERLMGTPFDPSLCQIVWHEAVSSHDDLLELEGEFLENGYEGVMLRRGTAPYKFGRATTKSGDLLKVKRFADAEYKVVGFEERMQNNNEAFTDELGRTKRSSHQENKCGRGDLGALVLETADGQCFNCGTGFDDDARAAIWASRDEYLGKMVKVKSFLIGVKDLPRFPVFLGFRDKRDL